MKTLKFFSYRKNSTISKTAKIYPFSIVLNTIIKDYSYISYNCTINNCDIGKFCSIAKSVKVGLGKHPLHFISTSPIFYSPVNPLKKILSKELKFKDGERITIGNDVWIGANVVILDGINIGNGAVIGANSVVTKNVLPYTIVGGVPAKEIKKRFSENIINAIQDSEWWDMPIHFFEQTEVNNIFSKEIDDKSIHNLLELIRKYKK
ncbi:CatB-related O-acetyltransferase [Flavobacterium taihuense]|uniref:CatB-related O-acetyltransferase n=1 Tax=Flavobacterium taihuense TaxID=2857508 RepID=A0ABS6XUL0_9FLAO|nr:CatB-related O-acetyltransferase [Flavobacterium taihuense]MBW4360347.1 CatB-related O-acetyltransferase [Flavobacterium taihuense]